MIRKMHVSDIPDLMRLKNAEGWNQMEEDWKLLINYKNSVNLIALQDRRIVGSITGINYENKVAWIGMMLVDKDYRGRGISKQLLKSTIEGLKDCDSIKLDATPIGRSVYKKINFFDEYSIHRITNLSVNKITIQNGVKPTQVTFSDLIQISNLDEQIFGANRLNMLNYLFSNAPELAWVIKDGDKIKGFSLGRKGTRFTQVGPVFASSDEVAKALIATTANSLIDKPVVVDLLADKIATKNWLEQNGFLLQRSFQRMYLNSNPHSGLPQMQYLIGGPELG